MEPAHFTSQRRILPEADVAVPTTLKKTEHLRQFVSERLTAAAEEIFRVFERTVVEYETELRRTRTLLDIVSQPRVIMPRIDQHVCKQEELPADQHHQDKFTSMDEVELQPPQIKEEQLELSGSQEGESLGEQEKFPSVDQERVSSVDQMELEPPRIKEEQEELYGNLEGERLAEQERSSSMDQETVASVDQMVVSSENKKELRPPQIRKEQEELHSSLAGGTLVPQQASGPFNLKMTWGHVPVMVPVVITQVGKDPPPQPTVKPPTKPGSGKIPCQECGKRFFKSGLKDHMTSHTGEKPHTCSICGKSFGVAGTLKSHMMRHTGDKPHVCSVCGKKFAMVGYLTRHMKTHMHRNLLRRRPRNIIIAPEGKDASSPQT